VTAVKIFVEGIADEKFLKDYLDYLLPNSVISSALDETVKNAGGWTNIASKKKEEDDSGINAMRKNTDNGGVNLVVFDADKDFEERKREIENWKGKHNLTFELFLLPDNKSAGALEDLLEKIIINRNKPILDCWDGFEACIQKSASCKMGTDLTIPAKKTKIYAYLEVLLGQSKKEKEKIKERERNYKNAEHWNLGCGFLEPLKKYLLDHIPDACK